MSSRLLVVSHPCVRAVNQLPYAELGRLGWDIHLVVPRAWRDEYTSSRFKPEALPSLAPQTVARPVLLPGRVQRHAYLARVARLITQIRPDVAFVEQEPTSIAGFQWARALARAGIPFGLQAAENLDRRWPLPARLCRHWTLQRASFVAARSPTAAALVQRRRPELPVPVVPHHVPAWQLPERRAHRGFVAGYAGRLVAEKGIDVLVEAAAGVDGLTVRLVGNGPLREELRRQASAIGVRLEIDSSVRHEDMAAAYSSFDVLVLPSRTTATWVEQFGRVLVEALWCGVPVIAADSGEIPWVVRSTGGGLLVAEGDAAELRSALIRLRDSPPLRRELARRGRERARELFSVEAVARRFDAVLSTALGHTGHERQAHLSGRAQHRAGASSSSA